MNTTELVSQVVQNEWSFGPIGMWYIAYCLCSRHVLGLDLTLAEGLTAFSASSMDNPRPPTRTAKGVAQAVRAVYKDHNAHVMLSALASFRNPNVFVPAPWWDDWPPLPWCLSRQDVEEHGLGLADVVVSWVDGQEIVAKASEAPDVLFQLHLYAMDPWATRDRLLEQERQAEALGMEVR